MIIGAHAIIYSTNADADRAFLRDVLKLTNVDVGGGWLICGLPPSEVAIHPGENNEKHEVYFMVADISAFVASMRGQGHECTDPADQGWGVLSSLTLPGGGKVGVYEPRHERPAPMDDPTAKKSKKKAAAPKKGAKKAAKAAKKAAKPAAKAKAAKGKAAKKGKKK